MYKHTDEKTTWEEIVQLGTDAVSGASSWAKRHETELKVAGTLTLAAGLGLFLGYKIDKAAESAANASGLPRCGK